MISYTQSRYRWGQLHDCTLPADFIKDIDPVFVDFFSAYNDNEFNDEFTSALEQYKNVKPAITKKQVTFSTSDDKADNKQVFGKYNKRN